MANYTYEDGFIVDSIDEIELNNAESKAIDEVGKLNISDTFYIEKLVKTKVYIKLSLNQLENEGMPERYKAYKKEYDEYISLALNNSSNISISSVQIARG